MYDLPNFRSDLSNFRRFIVQLECKQVQDLGIVKEEDRRRQSASGPHSDVQHMVYPYQLLLSVINNVKRPFSWDNNR